MFVAVFEGEFGDAGFVEFAEGPRLITRSYCSFMERASGRGPRLARTRAKNCLSASRNSSIAAHSTPVALREGILYVRVLQLRVALRARTNLQIRDPAETKTNLRQQNHPRRPLPRVIELT